MDKLIIQKATDILGGQKALADAIGVKQQHVWNWLNRDKRLQAEHVLNIERATNGQITRHQLRPDLYPKDDESVNSLI